MIAIRPLATTVPTVAAVLSVPVSVAFSAFLLLLLLLVRRGLLLLRGHMLLRLLFLLSLVLVLRPLLSLRLAIIHLYCKVLPRSFIPERWVLQLGHVLGIPILYIQTHRQLLTQLSQRPKP